MEIELTKDEYLAVKSSLTPSACLTERQIWLSDRASRSNHCFVRGGTVSFAFRENQTSRVHWGASRPRTQFRPRGLSPLSSSRQSLHQTPHELPKEKEDQFSRNIPHTHSSILRVQSAIRSCTIGDVQFARDYLSILITYITYISMT